MAKHPLEKNYNKHANVYHIVSQTVPLAVAIMMILFVETVPKAGGKTCGFKNNFVISIIFGFAQILDVCSLILIAIAVKVMNTGSRYLYRYIIFCIVEFVNDIAALGY